jgi:hypothetical protein
MFDGILFIITFLIIYMGLVIKLDEFVDRQIELQDYKEQIVKQVDDLIKEALANEI